MRAFSTRLAMLALTMVAGLGLQYARNRRRKNYIKRHFGEREKLSAQEFGARFFEAEDADIAVDVREIIAKALRADLSGLIPSDRFDKDLRVDQQGRDVMLKIITQIEEKYDIDMPASYKCMPMSIDVFAKTVSRKISSKTTTSQTHVPPA